MSLCIKNEDGEIVKVAGGGASTADKITYDNTESGFPATNVQEAVDDLIGNLRTKLDSPINYTKVGTVLTATSVDGIGIVNEVKWQEVELDVGVTDIKFSDDGESQTGTVIINAESIGLGNIDNTSDMDKPVSTATQEALDDKADTQHNHSAEDIVSMQGYHGEPYSMGSDYVRETDTLNEAIRKVELRADRADRVSDNIKHSIVVDNLIKTNSTTISRVGGVDFTLDDTGILRLSGKGEETENGFELGTSILFTQEYYDYIRYRSTIVSVDPNFASFHSIRIVVKGYIKTDSSVTETENVLDAVFSKDDYKKTFRLTLSKGNIYKVFVFPVAGEQYDNDRTLTIMMTHTQVDCDFQPYNLSRYSFREDIDKMSGVVDNLDKSSIGLDNVDNTSDMDKPISTATQTELDKKANKTFIDSVESETHVVTTPENVAGFAAIKMIGGKTIKDGDVLKSAPVERIVSKNDRGDIKSTVSIADITKNLPDYGCSINSLYNYIECKRRVYAHDVGILNMGELEWTFRPSDSLLYTSKDYNIAKVSKANIADVINSVYEVVSRNKQQDKTLSLTDITSVTNAVLAVKDSDFTLSKYSTTEELISAFTEHLKDEYITFELANKEEIPISDIIPPFTIESNGTIEFVNEHNLDVPNTVLYKKEVL